MRFETIKYVILALVVGFCIESINAVRNDLYYNFMLYKKCLKINYPLLCAKETALDFVNKTLQSEEPINFYNMVVIEKNPNFRFETDNMVLPDDSSQRSLVLNDALMQNVAEFFESRIFKFNVASAYAGEGRKKGGGGGGGGGGGAGGAMSPMMMIMGGGMAMMMGQMMMSKIAMMAGTALILAKIALMLSAIMGLKKMDMGGGGGEEKTIVVQGPPAPPSGGHGGHGGGGGGGGWKRSFDSNTPASLAYRAYN